MVGIERPRAAVAPKPPFIAASAEGTYEMTCTVRDHSGQRELDVRSRFVRFDVLKGDLGDKGILTLGGTWAI